VSSSPRTPIRGGFSRNCRPTSLFPLLCTVVLISGCSQSSSLVHSTPTRVPTPAAAAVPAPTGASVAVPDAGLSPDYDKISVGSIHLSWSGALSGTATLPFDRSVSTSTTKSFALTFFDGTTSVMLTFLRPFATGHLSTSGATPVEVDGYSTFDHYQYPFDGAQFITANGSASSTFGYPTYAPCAVDISTTAAASSIRGKLDCSISSGSAVLRVLGDFQVTGSA
jgi:hypothetical protein